MTLFQRASFSSLLFLCSHLLAPLCRTSCAAGSAMIEALSCSNSANYTRASAYAASLNQFLAALPQNAVSNNGGFFNGTVGEGTATVYGLAMCSADYSRADCGDCLAATAGSNTGGLPNRCPGSTTVLAVFDQCLVHYSDTNFLGTASTDIIYSSGGAAPSSSALAYSTKIKDRLQLLAGQAVTSPQRFAASGADPPYALLQCTWDLPPDKCKQCLDVLSANASHWPSMTIQGKRKSYSCTVRYSNTSFMVVPFDGAASSGQSPPTSLSGDQTTTSRAKGSRTVAMVIGSVVAVIVAALLVGCLWFVRRFPRQHKSKEAGLEPVGEIEVTTTPSTFNATRGNSTPISNTTTVGDLGVNLPRQFTYAELVDATSNFAEEKLIGRGGFGAVYKGTLPGIKGTVAIKRILDTSTVTAIRGFDKEIEIMIHLSHRNIVRLMGWCKEDTNLLLIHEKLKKRNLEDYLYPKKGITDSGIYCGSDCSQLDWPRRRNILLGIASGLSYLHTECRNSIVHRDIKPANIMLDKNFNAILGDFGLVTQLSHTQTSHETKNVIGTKLYIDPAYKETGKACGQNDVYSFGVMLLEIVCGEKPTLTDDEKKNNLVEKVQKCGENNEILAAVIQGLRGQFDKEIERVLEIGLGCVHPDRHRRPHIGHVKNLLWQLTKAAPSTSSQNSKQCENDDEEADENPLLARTQSAY